MTDRLRVLAVNHNRILRGGISVLIEMQPDLELVDSLATADAAIDRFSATRPDLTLMDLDLPADSALDAIYRIRQTDPAAWIIGLTTDERDPRCLPALMAGVSTLLAKDQIGTMLIALIRGGRPPQQAGHNPALPEELARLEIDQL